MLKLSALSAAFALILTACTLTPPSADKPTAANAPPAGCVAQTATRIQVKDTACAGPGNTYTKQDIERTGQANLGDALPMLDPAISKH
jgi:outer membrane cobalamin receptor